MMSARSAASQFHHSISRLQPALRWALRLGLAALLFLAACAIEQFASQTRQDSMFQLAPLAFDGFYGQEQSSTLPGLPPGEAHTYHWTRPASQLTLWPGTATSSVLDMQYLNQSGPALLQVNQDQPITLVEHQSMRRLHLLLPPGHDLTIQLLQIAPQTIEGRPLGLIVGDLQWSALGAGARVGELWADWRLLFGLPGTLLLLAVLGWALRLPEYKLLMLVVVALSTVALLALRWPWDARAMQPALQWLLLAALIGVGLFQLCQRRAFLSWTGAIIGVWCLSLVLFFSPSVSSDGVGYYAYLRSVFVDGDLNFSDEFDSGQSPFEHLPQRTPAPRPGYLVNSWSVGPALFWTPFWLVGRAIVRVGQQLGISWRGDGYDPPYIALIALASAAAGLATMLGSVRVFTRWFAPGTAALAAITLYLGSNLFYYAQFGGSFAHSLSAATATYFVLACLRLDERPTLSRWLGLGLATGALLVTYWITALLLVIPLGIGLRHLWQRARLRDTRGLLQLAGGALAAGGVAALVFLPQLLVWKLTLGSWLAIPQGAAYATPQQSHLFEMLFGSLYGLAWWTPAYFIGLVGSIWFAFRRPWPGALLLLASVLYLIYNASLPDWHGSGAFGLRRLTGIAPLLGIGLAAALDLARRYRPLPAMLAAALLAWSLGMTLRYVSFQLPHDPYTLQGLGLRPILLSQAPLPLDALLAISRNAWFGALLRNRDAGSLLIACTCLVIGVTVLLLWKTYR